MRMRTVRSHALPAAIVAGALGLGVAGCGGSSKSTSSSTTVAASSNNSSTTSSAASKHKAAKHKATKKKSATHTTSTTTSTSTSHTTHATTTTKASTHSTAAFVGPMRATLTGANHDPTVNVPWPYSVTATDANGKPLSGTVDIEFTFNGTVVGHDTPPTHPIRNGHWGDNLKFPPQAIGEPIALQAVIHTILGTQTIDWAIKVKK